MSDTDDPGAEPLAAEPLAADPLAADPLAADPLGADPLGADPLGADPLGEATGLPGVIAVALVDHGTGVILDARAAGPPGAASPDADVLALVGTGPDTAVPDPAEAVEDGAPEEVLVALGDRDLLVLPLTHGRADRAVHLHVVLDRRARESADAEAAADHDDLRALAGRLSPLR